MNFARLAIFAACFAITSFWMSGAALLAEEPQELEARYRAVLKSHRESMAKLKTGEATITGTLKDVSKEAGVLQGGINALLVFDNAQGLHRFDRTEPRRVWREGAGARKNVKDWIAAPTGGRFVRTPTVVIFKNYEEDTACIKKLDYFLPNWVRPIDLRILGLAHVADIDRGTLSSRIEAIFDSQIPASIDEVGPLIKVTWMIGKINRRTVWFDTEKGYWPVRFTLEEANRVDAQRNLIWNKVNAEEIKTELVRKEGVYVPSDVVIYSQKMQREELLHFDWKSVNSKVDYQLFTPEGMSQNDIRCVTDDTMGELKIRELPGFIPPPEKK